MGISNKLSFILGAAEIFIYAGGVFGWSFIEYILKQESIFFTTYCGHDNRTDPKLENSTFTASSPLYCPAGQKAFQSAFTWMLVRVVLFNWRGNYH